MDLQLIIAKLHQELGFIDRAIADLERLAPQVRRKLRPRNGCKPHGRAVERPGVSAEERGSC